MRQKSTGQVPTVVSGYGRLQVNPWSRLESSCRLPRPTFSRDWLCQPGCHKRPAPAWRSAPSRATATLSWTEHNHAPYKFMVFFDSKRKAELASQFLQNRMPENLKHKVKWFHAGMSEFFRKEELQSYKEGDLWGLGMTDVGGMVGSTCRLCGCNASDSCITICRVSMFQTC